MENGIALSTRRSISTSPVLTVCKGKPNSALKPSFGILHCKKWVDGVTAPSPTLYVLHLSSSTSRLLKQKPRKQIPFLFDGHRFPLELFSDYDASEPSGTSLINLSPTVLARTSRNRKKRQRAEPYGNYSFPFNRNETEHRNRPALGPFGLACEKLTDKRNCDCHFHSEVFFQEKFNYKMYANIGWSPADLQQQLTIVDTGAAGNFVRTYVLPAGLQTKIHQGPARIYEKRTCVSYA